MWYIGDILLASVYALVSPNLLDVQSNMGMQITLLLCVRKRIFPRPVDGVTVVPCMPVA